MRVSASGQIAEARTVDAQHDPSVSALGAAALELYQNRLLNDARPVTYLAARGFSRDVVDRWYIGFAPGGELAEYLIWRCLSVGCARRLGLLDKHGRERLAGPIVIPEMRQRQAQWLTVVRQHPPRCRLVPERCCLPLLRPAGQAHTPLHRYSYRETVLALSSNSLSIRRGDWKRPATPSPGRVVYRTRDAGDMRCDRAVGG